MIEKWFKLFLGEKFASSLTGIAGGALTGAVTVAATGNLSKEALLIGAAGGAVAAMSGAGGRMTGEK